ncbi:MAG: TonB-dependent receptor plug domain-containing protein [Dysgonamonadaceae bacterium]|jgi:TonB-dependent SusC/RagA subfamily outer membrane receptor|nr:TonB-dependent receptor plug domain-containing protein [Dysgonamonadaceae bacterium]
MKLLFAALGSILFTLNLYSQNDVLTDSIYSLFNKQLRAYPLEKIYACTDKPCYLAGEDIHYRIYLTDALSLISDTSSRYVYAELINPWDELVSRVKIRPVAGAYHGYFKLPEDLAEGSYQIRFYTRFMEGRGDDCFFKRKIDVGDPLSALYLTRPQYKLSGDGKKIEAEFGFYDVTENSRILPEKVRIRNEKERKMDELKLDSDSLFRYSFDAHIKKNVIYMEYDYNGKFHKAFMPVATGMDDYDVGFYPEGGHCLSGVRNKLAFKAVNRSGLGENVSGIVVNEYGDTLHTIQSIHRGMGVFYFLPQKGMKYRFLCQNEAGLKKTFELPAVSDNAISININTIRDGITVSAAHSPELKLPENMYLIIHYGGYLLSAIRWENSQKHVLLKKEDLPLGVSHILLVDAELNPLSERLIFSVNEKYFPQSTLVADRPAYGKRQAVNFKFTLLDSEEQPLDGDFSVSVTDDRDVVPDSTVNILSTLLLTSELKGYIEDPAFYFIGSNNMRSYFLDILMMTQGWRIYDIPQTLKGNIQRPKGYLEVGPAVTGTAKGGLLMTSTAKGIPVKIVSYGGGYFDETITNNEGQFIFNIPEMPDSTRFVIQATTKKGGSRIELRTDTVFYPEPRFGIPLSPQDNNRFATYMKKADQAFIQEFGMHSIYLDEVVVRARRREKKGKSSFSSPFNTIVSSSEFENRHPHTIFDILRTIAGVSVTGENVSIRGAGTPLVIIDDMPNEADVLSYVQVEDIDEIEVVKDAQAAIFGSQGGNGVIMITTKRGFDQTKVRTPSFNIKAVIPLGYQIPKEFYSPKYDTPEEIASPKADLRTTIYWNPDVKVNAGNADFKFYSADTDSNYSIVIEGITKTGKPFYLKKRIQAGQ